MRSIMVKSIMKINNKKGQYYAPPQRERYAHIHPVLIIGLAIVILHFLFPVMGMTSQSWVFGLGVFVTFVGGILSVMDSV